MKELFHISSAISPEEGQQILILQIGVKHCSFATTDISGKKLQQLAYYSVEEMDENPLINLFSLHPELNDSFYKILVSYDYPHVMLVPFKFYSYEESQSLLKTMHGVNGKAVTVSEAIAEWQVYNVYAVPKEIQEWINRKFPSAKFWHSYTVSIKNTVEANANGKFWIDFRADDFTLIAVKENKFLLAQTFLYLTPVDVIYYLLKVCRQFSILQQEVKLVLSGLIEKESALYKELYQYFLNIEFENADWNVSDANKFPDHFFTSLNNLLQCAS